MKARSYTIVTPAYGRSAGVRVLHTLCHELNELGFVAKLVLMGGGVPPHTNPKFNTPCLLKQENQYLDESIVIYPEVISGNPLGAKNVVRYILNREGYINGQSMDSEENDFILSYSRAFVKAHQTLFIPVIDLNEFRFEEDSVRDQNMLWIGKGKVEDLSGVPKGLVGITSNWPETPRDMAVNFKRTKFLYSFDFMSSINIEAVMCGAVTVLFGKDKWGRKDLEFFELGVGGFAFGDSPSEIDRAIKSRGEQIDKVRQYTSEIRGRVLNFVDATQSYFKKY